MKNTQYRAVEVNWVKGGRVEKDIGCSWKTEPHAKEDMREMERKYPARTFGIQKKDKS